MYQINNEKFGKFITELRKKKNLTQRQLADQLYVSDKTVSKWERGASFPNVVMLIPIAESLGVSVTELLMGEYLKDDDMIQHNDVNNIVSYSLESTAKDLIIYNKRKWQVSWVVSLIVVLIEFMFLWLSNYPAEDIKGLVCVSGIMMIFSSWSCFFARELPKFYDEQKVNFVSQGIFRIHMPGLVFNNSNWPKILNALRFFSLIIAIGAPMYYYVSILIGGYELFEKFNLYVVCIVILLVVGSIYYLGKKYE